MLRKIIRIDEEKCNGCGLCIPDCPEGALQVIDGKARLVGDLLCDGLGACIGRCPEGAISVEVREAEPYNEKKVMENIVPQGRNTILAHLDHLRKHGEQGYLDEAIAYIKEHKVDMRPEETGSVKSAVIPGSVMGSVAHSGCPGTRPQDLRMIPAPGSGALPDPESGMAGSPSQLGHWPVQFHLINPGAAFLQGADVLLCADCVPFAMGDFHGRLLRGRPVIIACPKLDSNQESYLEKLKALIIQGKINTLTVAVMEVPCCGGLIRLALSAREQSGRYLPVKMIKISIKGDILQEDWMQ